MSDEDLFFETTKLVSPVYLLDGKKNIPPHSTGAAIDVYLIDTNGSPVDMGMLIEDWSFDSGAKLSKTNYSLISHDARENRNIMINALSKVGFVNYPNEYWHWSYGDRYWAYHTKTAYAIYDLVESD